ncbi:protein of unknown function (plasmid) [Cupriavidus taiwanensis]|uniref:Uncharacterized protein n=1 Tax=Cupriavidus taiwanensis TaxID=164546 RepID=A0A9Q7UYY4_9BURK|nr:protein of unknown function [Cupriavidus taiwanensis]
MEFVHCNHDYLTVLQNKHDPLFDVLRAPLREFIQTLKSRRG